ncbi:MAG: redoxin domain-containing protein [Verrucomicrobiota bacterium]
MKRRLIGILVILLPVLWFARGVVPPRFKEPVKYQLEQAKWYLKRQFPSKPEQPPSSLVIGPRIIAPGEAGIGRQVSDFKFAALSGERARLSEFRDQTAMVIAMTSATCPVSKRFFPKLVDLHSELAAKNIGLLLVNPFASEEQSDIDRLIREANFGGTYIRDVELSIARTLDASTTTEVFLLDSSRTLNYRGAISDQYGISYSREESSHEYLKMAIDSLLAGTRPTIAATEAPGCELFLGGSADPAVSDSGPTYHREISRIIQRNCLECHYDGGEAPFALDSYEAVVERSRVIQRVVSDGLMPPWFAARQPHETESPWANERSLSDRERRDLMAWLNTPGFPEGEIEDTPESPILPHDGWKLGPPDHIIAMPEPVEIPAEGTVPYVRIEIPTRLSEDRWVRALEILPGNRELVHHIVVYNEEDEANVKGLVGVQDWMVIYAPGNTGVEYPPGFARKVKASGNLSFQIHYVPNGTAGEDLSQLGLHFAPEPPDYEVLTGDIVDLDLRIPPNQPKYISIAEKTLRRKVGILAYFPHMHYRGKSFRYELIQPGNTTVLLEVPNYLFSWQLNYRLKEPLLLHPGSTLRATATFDNSAENPANPDPSQVVRWGKRSVDEMMLGFYEYFIPVGDDDWP